MIQKKIHIQTLVSRFWTLPMLRLLSSKAQGRKVLWNPSKPCYVGIHWKALALNSQMSTHLQGFSSFSMIFASFCIGHMRHQQRIIRWGLLDLLVPRSFPDQFHRVGREIIKDKKKFFFKLTHRNLSKQTVGREAKKSSDFWASTKIHT